jgi:hypothetical protein
MSLDSTSLPLVVLGPEGDRCANDGQDIGPSELVHPHLRRGPFGVHAGEASRDIHGGSNVGDTHVWKLGKLAADQADTWQFWWFSWDRVRVRLRDVVDVPLRGRVRLGLANMGVQ